MDPRNNCLVILGVGGNSRPVLLIYDRFTLALEARLQCPVQCTTVDPRVELAEVDTVANRVWVVGYGGRWSGGSAVPLIGFDLKP